NKLSFKGTEYGFSGLDILQFKDNRWIRIAESPFETVHYTVFQKKIIIANPSLDKRLEVNPKTGEFTPFELPKEIIPPTLSLKSITFSSGSSGCFHFDDHTRVYELKGEKLKLVKGNGDFLKKMPKELDIKLVGEILSVAHNSRLDQLTVADLELTAEDYTNFKTFITQKEEEMKQNQNSRLDYRNPYSFPGENTDFDFYKNIVDSLSTIDSKLIGDTFTNGYGNWSTTTDWHQVIFKFTNGSSLLISNMDDIASYHYAPWIINFDGLTYKTNSLKLGALINDITKGDFFEAHAFESNYALFKIADYLYRKKLTSQNQ
ncbi:MAG: hypothetical protein MI810_02265, partial [Flavobacteriales bacterium]|nr:hypothetical protein [Flavobacteriales bacterium]